jgi:hypothetical protein
VDVAPPFRQATRTRRSASGPGDRVASGRDITIYFREDCRPLRDSLQLEMVVAQYCLRMRDVTTTGGVPVGEAVGLRVVAELEHMGDALSHAILRGLAHIGVGLIGERSSEAVARLSEKVLGLPKQFADVGNARPVRTWRGDNAEVAGEYILFARFEHPRGPEHAIALYVEPRGGDVVKHIGLVDGGCEDGMADSLRPNAPEPLEIPSGGALMNDVLERTYDRHATRTDDFRVLIAAARARSIMRDTSARRRVAGSTSSDREPLS